MSEQITNHTEEAQNNTTQMLRQAMRVWGVKVKEVAAATGKTPNYIALVLRGERRNLAIAQAALQLVEQRIAAHEAMEARLQELAEQEA